MRQKYVRTIAFIIVATMVITSLSFVVFLPGMFGATSCTVYAGTTSGEQKYINEQLDYLEEYVKFIHDNFKDEVSYNTLMNGAFTGIAESLQDPFSVYYVTKQQSDSFTQSVSGSYEGVGITMEDDNGQCKIVSPNKTGPAAKAGIKSGDYIVKVDEKDVSGMTLSDISAMLKGKKGTTVKLTVKRNGTQVAFTVTRDVIKAECVDYKMLDDNIGYISMSGFDDDANIEFRKAKITLVNSGAEGLILDLRDNPGGYVEMALDISDQVLKSGDMSHFKWQGKIIESHVATAVESLDLPIVLLTNGGTASASEILIAALKDNKAASVVGTRTYGKGIAQRVMTLANGNDMKLSVMYFLTPNKDNIQTVGITPDYTVSNTTGVNMEAVKTMYNKFAPMAEKAKPKAGDTGLNVYAAQQRLELLGYNLKPTGTMDNLTVNVVRAFQKENGLYAYGTLDYATMNTIEKNAHDYAYGVSKDDKQMDKAIEVIKAKMN